MDCYDILGVGADASEETIKSAYRAMIRKYHPDVYPGDKEYAVQMTQNICQAYKILSNPEQRAEYDQTLRDMKKVNDDEEEDAHVFCWKCGRANPVDSSYCTGCGAKMTAETLDTVEDEATDLEESVVYREKAGKTRRFMFWLPATILIPLLLIGLINKSTVKQRPIQNVPTNNAFAVSQIPQEITLLKESYLTDYSTTRTIGEAFNSFFSQPTWKVVKHDEQTEVQFDGGAADADTNAPVKITVTFIKYGTSYQVASWQRNGIPQNVSGLPLLLRKIYE